MLPNLLIFREIVLKKNLVVIFMFEGQDELRNKEFPQLMDGVWLSSSAFTPHEPERRGALINVRVDEKKDLKKIVEILEEKYKVTVTNRFGGLRFSAHLYNTENDIQSALSSLKEVIAMI